MSMSRRKFLATGSAFGAAWLGTSLGGCAASAPRATSLASGVTRVNLGPVTVTMLADGYGSRPLDANFVRNASLADVQAALRDAGLPTDRLEITYTIPVVDIGSQRVLFDTGNGEFGAASAGKLLENMSRAGIDPQSITAVVISHFHGDHINGLRNKAGVVVFPNAKIFVPQAEWAWWMDDARMAAAPEAMKGAFAAPRRVFGPLAASVTRFEPGAEVLPGVKRVGGGLRRMVRVSVENLAVGREPASIGWKALRESTRQRGLAPGRKSNGIASCRARICRRTAVLGTTKRLKARCSRAWVKAKKRTFFRKS